MRSHVTQPGLNVSAGIIRIARDCDGDVEIVKSYDSGSESDRVYVEGSTVVEFVNAIKAMFPMKFRAPAALPVPVAAPKRRPHGAQEYKGNGNHTWEAVNTVGRPVARLRVPGGWLYKPQGGASVFVPIPNTVGYPI